MSKPPNPNQATAKVEKAEVVKQLPTEISDVMNEIQTFWNFMTPETFNPVPHSLTLLDSSSLGRDYKSFLKIYEKLEIAMDIIVNDYHQGFNNAIQKFSGVVENIADSKTRVLRMQSDLENCKDWLQNKRFDLFHLWIKSLQYSEMIRILDLVEGLMDVKKKLKYLKQEKFVLSACKLLLSSIKALNSVECQSIVALENIREKLKEYKKTLPELLLDELQNHLYLKSPYSLYRLENDANYEPESRVDKNIEKTFAESASIKAFRAQIAKTTKFFDDKEILEEDFDRNPEADSYTYMHSIVLGMHLLGNLPKSLKTLNERLSLELHYVIEKTIQEVDLRNEKILMTLKDSRAVDSKTNVTSNLVANNVNNLTLKTSDYKPDLIGIEKKIEHSKVFRDLLNSLYRKFEVIVQGHFFVLHVAHSIAELDQVEGVYTIRDVWFTVQNEVKRLLYDYIANVDQKKIANAVISMDEVMKKKIQDQTSKQLYRIMNGNFNLKIHDLYKNISGNEVYGNAEDLQTGRDSVTNDILKRMKEGGGTDKVANSGIIDKFETSKTVGRKLLLSSDPYNILIAFEPTCEFMENVEETIGVRFGTFKTFLDDFIFSVFIPRMEDRVLNYFHQFVNGVDAFQPENSTELSELPLMKGVIAMSVLIQGMCKTIYSLPVHQEECVKMIEMMLMKFYEKCSSRYRTLLSSEGAEVENEGILSNIWTNNEEIVEILSQNPYLTQGESINSEFSKELSNREIALEMKLKTERSIHRSELVFDSKKLGNLANLHHSVEWFTNHVADLRTYSTKSFTKSSLLDSKFLERNASSESFQLYSKYSMESLPSLPVNVMENDPLPLTPEMAEHVDLILKNFSSLSQKCLFALRLELRLHSMYYLDLAMREGSYCIFESVSEPDPYIWALNADLTSCEEAISNSLSSLRLQFLFDGLSHLMCHNFFFNLKHVKRVNDNGKIKLIRNVQSLKQCLTNISSVKENGLERASQYFNLLNLEGHELIKFVEENPRKFNFDEYKIILTHIFDDELNESEEGSVGRKNYSNCLQSLKDYFVKHRF